MKFYYLFLLFSISTFCNAQQFDINQLSENTRLRLSQYYETLNHAGFYSKEKKEAIESFYIFLEDSATTKDLVQLLAYDRTFRLHLYEILINRPNGFFKIELLKHELHKLDRYIEYYECISPPSSEPKFTLIGKFLSEQSFTTTEQDSLYEIIFTIPNELQQLQGYLLVNIENQSKHLDMITAFAQRTGNYMTAIPLLKYRFEEEKELVLELLEKWLNDTDDGSMYWNYMSAKFKHIFDIQYHDAEIRALLVKYFETAEHLYYYKQVVNQIASWKDTTARDVLLKAYNTFSKNNYEKITNNLYVERTYEYQMFLSAIFRNNDTLYNDLYYALLYDEIISSYYTQRARHFGEGFYKRMFKINPERYRSITLKAFRDIKDISNNIRRYYLPSNLPLKYITVMHPDSTQGQANLLEFLNAKNVFVIINALDNTEAWLEKYSNRNALISNRLYELISDNKDIEVVYKAVDNLLMYPSEKDKDWFLEWYENVDESYQDFSRINQQRKKIIEERVVKE